jgi:hypothetical protein
MKEWVDPDEIEQARNDLEDAMVKVGEETGMVDSRCISNFAYTVASYEAPDGSNHYFDLAPIGEIELPQ